MSGVERLPDCRDRSQQTIVMLPGTRRDPGVSNAIDGVVKELLRGRQQRVIRRGVVRAGGRQHEQPGQLGGHEPQILEMPSDVDHVRRCLVVDLGHVGHEMSLEA